MSINSCELCSVLENMCIFFAWWFLVCPPLAAFEKPKSLEESWGTLPLFGWHFNEALSVQNIKPTHHICFCPYEKPKASELLPQRPKQSQSQKTCCVFRSQSAKSQVLLQKSQKSAREPEISLRFLGARNKIAAFPHFQNRSVLGTPRLLPITRKPAVMCLHSEGLLKLSAPPMAMADR